MKMSVEEFNEMSQRLCYRCLREPFVTFNPNATREQKQNKRFSCPLRDRFLAMRKIAVQWTHYFDTHNWQCSAFESRIEANRLMRAKAAEERRKQR